MARTEVEAQGKHGGDGGCRERRAQAESRAVRVCGAIQNLNSPFIETADNGISNNESVCLRAGRVTVVGSASMKKEDPVCLCASQRICMRLKSERERKGDRARRRDAKTRYSLVASDGDHE